MMEKKGAACSKQAADRFKQHGKLYYNATPLSNLKFHICEFLLFLQSPLSREQKEKDQQN